MMASNTKHVVILGAGVTGLQTALSLLTSPAKEKYKVTIVAEHLPGDLSPEYTSPWAGGHWRSHATLSPEDKLPREFDERTFHAWIKLLESGDGVGPKDETPEQRTKRIGLGFSPALDFWGSETDETKRDGSGLWWTKPGLIRELELLTNDDLKAQGAPKASKAVFGVSYESININAPQYLTYLLSRITSLGARIIKTKIPTSSGLPGVIQNVKLLTNTPVFTLVNCTGLAARHFVNKEEAEKLYPIRGQTILVKGEARKTVTLVHSPSTPSDEILYVIPRPGSGTTILGGCKQAGNYSSEVDKELSGRILERVGKEKVAEDLRNEKGEFEIISEQAGFRPGRKGGPRVEVEGKVEGTWVVHSYGHAGAGYQNSIGCAERVFELIGGLERERAKL